MHCGFWRFGGLRKNEAENVSARPQAVKWLWGCPRPAAQATSRKMALGAPEPPCEDKNGCGSPGTALRGQKMALGAPEPPCEGRFLKCDCGQFAEFGLPKSAFPVEAPKTGVSMATTGFLRCMEAG